jgi:hypothetical protein
MKKIKILCSEGVATFRKHIILVPDDFKFKESKDQDSDDNVGIRFRQIEKKFVKSYKPLKLRENQCRVHNQIHSVEEIHKKSK